MSSIIFKKSTMIVTDSSQVAGIIVGNFSKKNPSIPVTKGMVNLIKKTYFSRSLDEVPKDTTFSKNIKFLGMPKSSSANDNLNKLLEIDSIFTKTKDPVSLGRIKLEKFTKPGFIKIGGIDHFHPPGKMLTRKMGKKTIHFFIGQESLKGTIKPQNRVSAIEISKAKSIIHVGQSTGAAANCGVCGVCGACGLCGEINFGSASAAAWALFSVGGSFTSQQVRNQAMRNLGLKNPKFKID